MPFTDQEDGTLKCTGKWLNPVPKAPKWFTRSETEVTCDLLNLVETGVQLEPISPRNMVPRVVRKATTEANAMRISEDSHNFILDEIVRRERLEYDPSRVLVGDEEEDLDCESDNNVE